VVSSSPFVLKLQTFLRMANIKYVHDPKNHFGRKGKMPWIELDGKDYCDSTFIIEFLRERFNLKIDNNLNEQQQSLARVIQKTIEENTLWAMIAYPRFVEDFEWFRQTSDLPWIVGIAFRIAIIPSIKKSMNRHGIGRHSPEEIRHIAKGDVKALSNLLNDKKYFLGDEPSTIDAVVFGFLANVLCGLRNGSWPNQMIKKEAPNLVAFFERMKEKYWPDWDQ
ncbi:uncharacterized protein TRIADDRAFT_5603, partial [Trichoplax adhaerens]